METTAPPNKNVASYIKDKNKNEIVRDQSAPSFDDGESHARSLVGEQQLPAHLFVDSGSVLAAVQRPGALPTSAVLPDETVPAPIVFSEVEMIKDCGWYCIGKGSVLGVVTFSKHSIAFEPDTRFHSVRRDGIATYQALIDIRDVVEVGAVHIPEEAYEQVRLPIFSSESVKEKVMSSGRQGSYVQLVVRTLDGRKIANASDFNQTQKPGATSFTSDELHRRVEGDSEPQKSIPPAKSSSPSVLYSALPNTKTGSCSSTAPGVSRLTLRREGVYRVGGTSSTSTLSDPPTTHPYQAIPYQTNRDNFKLGSPNMTFWGIIKFPHSPTPNPLSSMTLALNVSQLPSPVPRLEGSYGFPRCECESVRSACRGDPSSDDLSDAKDPPASCLSSPNQPCFPLDEDILWTRPRTTRDSQTKYQLWSRQLSLDLVPSVKQMRRWTHRKKTAGNRRLDRGTRSCTLSAFQPDKFNAITADPRGRKASITTEPDIETETDKIDAQPHELTIDRSKDIDASAENSYCGAQPFAEVKLSPYETAVEDPQHSVPRSSSDCSGVVKLEFPPPIGRRRKMSEIAAAVPTAWPDTDDVSLSTTSNPIYSSTDIRSQPAHGATEGVTRSSLPSASPIFVIFKLSCREKVEDATKLVSNSVYTSGAAHNSQANCTVRTAKTFTFIPFSSNEFLIQLTSPSTLVQRPRGLSSLSADSLSSASAVAEGATDQVHSVLNAFPSALGRLFPSLSIGFGNRSTSLESDQLSEEQVTSRSCSFQQGTSMRCALSYFIPPGASRVMTDHVANEIAAHLPVTVASCAWTLLFCSRLHGVSFQTFYRMTKDAEPCLIVIRDNEDATFGVFTAVPLHMSPRFYGTGETFVYTFKPEDNEHTKSHDSPIRVFRSSSANAYFIFSSRQSLAVGGGTGKFAITVDNAFFRGTSQPCSTFCSPCLASSVDFILQDFQVWTFT